LQKKRKDLNKRKNFLTKNTKHFARAPTVTINAVRLLF